MITELKVGDYIEKSELDTEQKYNDVVEVLIGLGFKANKSALNYSEHVDEFKCTHFFIDCDHEIDSLPFGEGFNIYCIGKKLTYSDIMNLKKVDIDNCNIDKVVNPFEQMVRNKTERDRGSLKRAFDSGNMDAVKEVSKGDKIVIGPSETFREDASCKEMVKAAKASLAMGSLGYEYDEDKQQWFRREYL